MKAFLVVILAAMLLLIIYNIYKAKKCHSEMAKVIARLLSVALITVVAQICFIVTGNKTFALVIQGLYYASIDWLLIALIHYIQLYTEVFNENKVVRFIVTFFALAETISFIINIFTNHIFEIKDTIFKKQTYMTAVGHGVFFQIHLVFSYIIVAFCISSLIIKAVKTHKLYRKKYLTVLFVFITVILLNAVYLLSELPFDISILFYCCLAVLINYYSLFYQPKELIDNTLSLVVEGINDAIICFDILGECVYINKTFNKIFNNNEKLMDDIKKKLIESSEENKYEFNDEVQWTERMTVDGQERYFNLIFHKLFNKKHEYIGCFYTISDRTKEIEDFNRERYRMTHDKMTGVYTREYFFDAVEKRLREHIDEKFCMVCSGIKSFKIYNDLFGEKQGNEILKMEADLLREYSHGNSIYGRISGDKFAVLVPKDIYDEDIFIKSMGKMKQRFDNEICELHIHAGVYVIEDNTEPASLICDKAKLAIEALGDDYNTLLTYYDKSLLEKSIYERKILSEFEKALLDKQFVMYLQPQISADNKLCGAEALVRWNHPEKGIMNPGEFIGVLEKTGLIYKLDKYIWECAAKCLANWKKHNIDWYISINVSVRDFDYMDIYREITSLVEKYNIEPCKFKVEITETVFVKQKDKIKDILNNLRKYGITVEMDDFGSGYSSLNMLKEIDVDVVKIDMGFMRETDRDERSNYILQTIIQLIQKLGMDVITEGVETKGQVDNVTNMGCNLFQGYFFDKPMNINAFEDKYLPR